MQLESVSAVRVRYLIIVSTLASKQESVLLGMDFPNSERCVWPVRKAADWVSVQLMISNHATSANFFFYFFFFAYHVCSDQCTIGLVLPVWSDTQVYLDGDG